MNLDYSLADAPTGEDILIVSYYDSKDRYSYWIGFINRDGDLVLDSKFSNEDGSMPETEEIIGWHDLKSFNVRKE